MVNGYFLPSVSFPTSPSTILPSITAFSRYFVRSCAELKPYSEALFSASALRFLSIRTWKFILLLFVI